MRGRTLVVVLACACVAAYLQRISKELPGTAYDQKAQKWLADLTAVPKEDRFCLGCHAR